MEVTKDKPEMGMVRTTLGESQPLATMYAKEMKEYKNDILGRRACSWAGVGRTAYHLHGETGNPGWKIKWFASFRLESFRNYGLPVGGMHAFYSF